MATVNLKALAAKEIRLANILGRSHVVAYGDLFRTGLHPYTMLFLVISIVALTLLDANGYQDHLPVWATAIVWTVGVLATTFSYMAMLCLWAIINLRLDLRTIWFPLIGFLASFVTVISADLTADILAGRNFDIRHALSLVPYTFLIILLFDILHFVFALPVIQAHAARQQKAPVEKTITLASRAFASRSIEWAMSQDHYLKISVNGRTEMILARMADLVDQLDSNDGVQPHRSWWVAAASVREILREKGGEWVLLNDGTRVPVARGRSGTIRAWIESHPHSG